MPWDDAGPYLRFSVTYEAADEAAEDALMAETERRLQADRAGVLTDGSCLRTPTERWSGEGQAHRCCLPRYLSSVVALGAFARFGTFGGKPQQSVLTTERTFRAK